VLDFSWFFGHEYDGSVYLRNLGKRPRRQYSPQWEKLAMQRKHSHVFPRGGALIWWAPRWRSTNVSQMRYCDSAHVTDPAIAYYRYKSTVAMLLTSYISHGHRHDFPPCILLNNTQYTELSNAKELKWYLHFTSRKRGLKLLSHWNRGSFCADLSTVMCKSLWWVDPHIRAIPSSAYRWLIPAVRRYPGPVAI
jgi:hypothetical protein